MTPKHGERKTREMNKREEATRGMVSIFDLTIDKGFNPGESAKY
jgi:hypothetical protein